MADAYIIHKKWRISTENSVSKFDMTKKNTSLLCAIRSKKWLQPNPFQS